MSRKKAFLCLSEKRLKCEVVFSGDIILLLFRYLNFIFILITVICVCFYVLSFCLGATLNSLLSLSFFRSHPLSFSISHYISVTLPPSLSFPPYVSYEYIPIPNIVFNYLSHSSPPPYYLYTLHIPPCFPSRLIFLTLFLIYHIIVISYYPGQKESVYICI